MVQEDIETLLNAMDRLDDRMALEFESIHARLDLLAQGLGVETTQFVIDRSAVQTQATDTKNSREYPILKPKTES